jgi:hypothetical protein
MLVWFFTTVDAMGVDVIPDSVPKPRVVFEMWQAITQFEHIVQIEALFTVSEVKQPDDLEQIVSLERARDYTVFHGVHGE